MDAEEVKKFLSDPKVDDLAALPPRFFESLVASGLRLELVEPGRVLCSYTVLPGNSNPGNYLHGGVIATLVDMVGSSVFLTAGIQITGVSLDINISYLDLAFIGEEIEIEAKILRIGKTIAVASVDLMKKGTGKLIAQGRHTKYLLASSKL